MSAQDQEDGQQTIIKVLLGVILAVAFGGCWMLGKSKIDEAKRATKERSDKMTQRSSGMLGK